TSATSGSISGRASGCDESSGTPSHPRPATPTASTWTGSSCGTACGSTVSSPHDAACPGETAGGHQYPFGHPFAPRVTPGAPPGTESLVSAVSPSQVGVTSCRPVRTDRRTVHQGARTCPDTTT